MDNAKNCERADVPLEKREMEEKMQDMERGSTRVNVGGVEREIGELLRGKRRVFLK